jgi:glutamate--cysteine ligase
VCPTFVAGRQHELQTLGEHALYMPHGTSLRMGRLGYQSDAQASLAVSYNGLEGYAASLHEALTKPYPAYEAVGIRNPGGDYNQLATTLLQIENEFYGTIRPKRVIFPGERPLHALRERGVEYVEVRLLDLDPFEPMGITRAEPAPARCVPAALPAVRQPARHARRDRRTQAQPAPDGRARARERPELLRNGREVKLVDWGLELIDAFGPIARRLDAVHGTQDYTAAVQAARAALGNPDSLASARVLARMASQHGNSFISFTRAQSLQARDALCALPFAPALQARFEAMAAQSLRDQQAIEASDSLPFELYRQQYVSPERLVPRREAAVA